MVAHVRTFPVFCFFLFFKTHTASDLRTIAPWTLPSESVKCLQKPFFWVHHSSFFSGIISLAGFHIGTLLVYQGKGHAHPFPVCEQVLSQHLRIMLLKWQHRLGYVDNPFVTTWTTMIISLCKLICLLFNLPMSVYTTTVIQILDELSKVETVHYLYVQRLVQFTNWVLSGAERKLESNCGVQPARVQRMDCSTSPDSSRANIIQEY